MAEASTTQATPPVGAGVVAITSNARLAASYRYCHALTRERARNFYYGLKLTPEPKRSALYALYAFMRACDDLVDGEDEGAAVSVDERLAQIERFRADMVAAINSADAAALPAGELWPAVRHAARTYGIDAVRLHTMLDGQRADVLVHRYPTFQELYGYCYKVASVVGLACLDIWGHDGDRSVVQLAEYRGIAFQLTNILRDVAEDAQRGRVYLPQDELRRFGVEIADLREGRATAAFVRMMTYQVERARSYYEMSASLERHVDPACRGTTWAMTEIYRRLLERIKESPASVLGRRRVRLSSPEKLRIALRATWRQPWNEAR